MNFAYLLGEALGGAIASVLYILKISPFLLLGMLLFRLGVGCIRKQLTLLKLLQTSQQILDVLKNETVEPDFNLDHWLYGTNGINDKLEEINIVLRDIYK